MTFFCSEFWSGPYVGGENWFKGDKKLKKNKIKAAFIGVGLADLGLVLGKKHLQSK